MAQNSIIYLSATELAGKFKTGELSSFDVVSAYISQIEAQNKTYNAIVSLNKADAISNAREADLALKKGELWGKLHGVPVTIKDNYKTKGLTTTSGYLPLKNNVPDENAEIVKLLLSEGAIIIGKTNLSVLAMDMQADNPIYGKTNNPWDTTRTSGGSSGGCATALATGMTPLSFGNDLAGSIRLPSAYCGVYGFKPTFGVVSLKGIQTDPKEKTNGLKSLAVAGPLARNIDDLELSMQIIAQTTPVDQRLFPLNQYTDTIVNNKEVHYYMATQAYTTPFTMTESPVLSMPIALSRKSLPIGIQVIGERYKDFKLIEIGKVLDTFTKKFSFPLQE